MHKLFYQHYKTLNGSIEPAGQEKRIAKALTLHPYKDHVYLYKTRQYLHQTNMTQLIEHKEMPEGSIEEMKDTVGNDSGSQIDIENDASRTKGDIFQWRIAKGKKKRYYENVGRRRVLIHENNAINKNLHLLNKWLRGNGKGRRQKSFLTDENYIHQAVHPIGGHMNIVNAEVPSEVTRKKENRTYVVNQRFGELEVDGVKCMDNKEKGSKRINFVIPLCGKNDTSYIFMKTFEETCLKTGENVSLLVALFWNEKYEVQLREINNQSFETKVPEL